MKNKAREVFLILLFLNALLLAWAFFFPQLKLNVFGKEVKVEFLSFNDILYGDTTNTSATDSLIDKLIADTTAAKKDSALVIKESQIDSIRKVNAYLLDTVI